MSPFYLLVAYVSDFAILTLLPATLLNSILIGCLEILLILHINNHTSMQNDSLISFFPNIFFISFVVEWARTS